MSANDGGMIKDVRTNLNNFERFQKIFRVNKFILSNQSDCACCVKSDHKLAPSYSTNRCVIEIAKLYSRLVYATKVVNEHV